MYRLTGRLEQSQLADLFRGERVEARESVIIKLFHLKTSDAAYARVIADVSRQLQSVTHPGVARVLDVGLVDGHLAVVRQDTGKYTLGLALQRLNTREVFLPPALALALSLELLDVMTAAHAAGVVHGALTPGNVILGDDGTISVADFGALSALQASPTLKRNFGQRGRNSYRAPEIGAQDPATTSSDVYTLGAIIYELLTLREASTGNANVSTRAERLPVPSRLVRRLHSRIDPVIMRALESNAGRRHRTCAEFAEGIREFLVSQGGVPPREDLKKFIGELFPNEVQLSATGPVPFERQFELTDIAGVGAVEADEAVPVVDRPSFSGGVVDDRTPTSDGLPVFTEAMAAAAMEAAPRANDTIKLPDLTRPPVDTEPMGVQAVAKKAVSEWDAPAAPMPTASPSAAGGPTPVDPLKDRVRVVEDFAVAPDAPKPAPPKPMRQRVAKTIMTFAVPFKREGDPSVPSYAEMDKRGKRTARVVSVFATMILGATVTLATYAFLRSTSDVKGTLISYLPLPIQRELAKNDTSVLRPPPPQLKPLKLQDFDKLHPEMAFNPNPDGTKPADPKPADPKPVEPKVEPKPDPKPEPKKLPADCYDAPKGKTAFLTVESSVGVRVQIDGKRVCVNAVKVPVTAGSHKVLITEPKTKQEYASTNRFEAGKVVKLMPVFQKR